jgi:hypothetical protein
MADIKAGEPFGLDTSALAKIDWALALERVIHDLRSDFIYAPHLSFIVPIRRRAPSVCRFDVA